MLSSQSSPLQVVGICDYPIAQFIWKNGLQVPQTGDIVYTTDNGSATLNGNNEYWHYERSITDPGTNNNYIIGVNASGAITSVLPCNA